jgi:hypothetical protein
MPKITNWNPSNFKVWTDETEYIKWFQQFWSNETKRITEQEKKRKRGRKPKGSRSLRIQNKEIILTFD